MAQIYSPLRYPGGKTKLYNLVIPIIKANFKETPRTYIEPFAGGAGLALKLLFNNDVDRLILNDIDPRIFAFWRSCLDSPDEMIYRTEQCTVNVQMWNEQKEIYNHYGLNTTIDVGFATFFLNRCNVSGILSGGPIGGHNQTGTYLLDARFNKKSLIEKFELIEKFREHIEFYNYDVLCFLERILPDCQIESTLLNIDPPYVKKGPMLYENSLIEEDHIKIAQTIKQLRHKWILTYDECDLIYNIYSEFRKEIINLNYSVGNNKHGHELLIYSDNIDLSLL